MAINSETLRKVIIEMATRHDFDAETEIARLSKKGLLPKKMTAEVKSTDFASKQAAELAKDHGLSPKDFPKGARTGKYNRITCPDINSLLKANTPDVNASPTAKKYAADNHIDLASIKNGSGIDGKIKLEDVKAFEAKHHTADEESSEDGEMPPMSPAAQKLCREYELEADDLAGIKGTGKNGKIKAEDLAEIIKELESSDDEDED